MTGLLQFLNLAGGTAKGMRGDSTGPKSSHLKPHWKGEENPRPSKRGWTLPLFLVPPILSLFFSSKLSAKKGRERGGCATKWIWISDPFYPSVATGTLVEGGGKEGKGESPHRKDSWFSRTSLVALAGKIPGAGHTWVLSNFL